MLLRSPFVAIIASIVLPIGLWQFLGAFSALSPLQAWLTPYGSVPRLLSGQMAPANWAQLLVVVLIWVVGLNALGVRRVRRRRSH